MMMQSLQLEIVSAEKGIFSGEVKNLVVTGEMGELGIEPGHAQLLTMLKPGYVRATLVQDEVPEALYYLSGGMLEVQPHRVSILADTAIRADELDEAEALAAKERAESALANKQSEINMATAMHELAEAAAQLQAISKLKKRAQHQH